MSYMKNTFSKVGLGAIALAATLSFSGTAADAVTVTFADPGVKGTITGSGEVKQNILANGTASIDFGWNATSPNAYLAYTQFTANSSFILRFDDYAPESDIQGALGVRSGFQLFAGSFGGSLTPLLTPNHLPGQGCGADVQANFGTTNCVLVTGAGNVPTAFLVPKEDFMVSGPGTFVLMFSEGNEPNNGSAEFLISAVPLPAGGLLLLTALGGMAVARRRRKAA